jgi:hypothetical protein
MTPALTGVAEVMATPVGSAVQSVSSKERVMGRNKKQRANGKIVKADNPTGLSPRDKEHELQVLRLRLAIAHIGLAIACAKVGAVILPVLLHLVV